MASVICIGSVLLFVSSQYYKADKREALVANTKEVIAATELSFSKNGIQGIDNLSKEYISLQKRTGNIYYLVDKNGKLVVCSEDTECRHTQEDLPISAINAVADMGYFDVTNLSGYYEENYFLVGQKLELINKPYYMFSMFPAEKFDEFLNMQIKSFLMTAGIIMVIAMLITYLVVRKIIKPIKEMTSATERFGKGDFSEKLKIYSDDELGRLAVGLNDMAYSLSQLENTRKSFIANVSHELKTPMTTIGGFVDGILDGTIPKEKHEQYLKIVSEEVSRLARLVRSMLNIAKYETGEVELKVEAFDICQLAIKTLFLFEHKINDRNIEIIGLRTDPIYVEADIDLVQQILYNLIENAVKFVNESGSITFSFEIQEGKVFVSIRNTGEGLANDELPKVFDRFYKTDESHGKDKTGVGLGLAIVRSIINLHGGQIRVKSTKGEFTEFAFSLPSSDKNTAIE